MKTTTLKIALSMVLLLTGAYVHAQVNELKRYVFEMNKECPYESSGVSQVTSIKYIDGNVEFTERTSVLDVSMLKDALIKRKTDVIKTLFNDRDKLKKLVIDSKSGIIFRFYGINNSSSYCIISPEEIKEICDSPSVSLTGKEYIQDYVAKQNLVSDETVKLLSNYGFKKYTYNMDDEYLYCVYEMDDASAFSVDVFAYFAVEMKRDPELAKELVRANIGFCVVKVDSVTKKENKYVLTVSQIRKMLNN